MPHEQIESRHESSIKTTENTAATAMSNEAHSLSKLNENNNQAQKQETAVLPGLTITQGEKPSAANQGEKKPHADYEKQRGADQKNPEYFAPSAVQNKNATDSQGRNSGATGDGATIAKPGAENIAQSKTDIPKEGHANSGEHQTESSGLAKPDSWKNGELQGDVGSSAKPDVWKNGELKGDVGSSAKPYHLMDGQLLGTAHGAAGADR